jgi:LCP family protein required for cell wall assembly
LPEGDIVRKRPAGTRLTDTIMILRIDPGAHTADVLSFPRDLRIPISGHGSARINSAYETGGPFLLIKTIDENFDIPIHHYIEVDFAGFRQLVTEIGGVPVYFPHPVRSVESVELEISDPGCWTLGPRMALGFARARKDYQVQDDDGDWHTDLGGDHSRIERQQLFVQLALRRAISKGARNPNTLKGLVDVGVGNVTIDTGLEVQDILTVGRAFRSFDPADLVTHTLPVDEAPLGGPAYLYLREEEAEPTLALFRGDPSPLAPSMGPGEVVVAVRNGTGAPGQATSVTRDLAAAGFETLVPGDTERGGPTRIRYAAGSEAAARLLARYLAGPARFEVDASLDGSHVMLMTGNDWFGLAEEPRPETEVPGPSTTTTTTTTTSTTPEESTQPGSTTEPEGEPGVEVVGDADDPDDPAFYRATAPPPGATCPLTP